MRIRVKEPGKPGLHIIIPTCLLLNPLSIKLSLKAIDKYTSLSSLEYSQVKELARAVKRSKRRFGRSWKLVEVKNADGTEVIIRL